MALLVVLLALLAEHSWRHLQDWRDYQWLESYADWMGGLTDRPSLQGWPGLLILLAPPLLLVGLVQLVLDDVLLGLLELLFAVAVLIYTLGPRDLDAEIDDYAEAYELGDDGRRAAAALALGAAETDSPGTEPMEQVARSVLYQAGTRLFGPVLWFVVLGPVGAVLYRLVQQLDEARPGGIETDEAAVDAARDLHGLLGWPVARLAAAAYALTGSFEDGVAGWRAGADEALDLADGNRRVLVETGAGAIHLEAARPSLGDAGLVRRSRGLVVRSLVVWVVLIALLTLGGVV